MKRTGFKLKKIVVFLMISAMVCTFMGCLANCKVAGCDEGVYRDGLCSTHSLELTSYEINEIEREIENIERQIEENQRLIDYYSY